MTVLIISTLILACSKDKGEFTSKKLNYEAFNSIELKSSDKVFVSYGDKFKIEVIGYEKIIDGIQNDIVNNTLVIDREKYFTSGKDASLSYEIILPKIVSAKVIGSGDILIDNFNQTEALSFSVNGSGDINFGKFKNINKIDADVNGSGGIYSNSIIYIDSLSVNVNGSGDFKGYEVKSKNAKAKLTGSGTIKLSASETLNVNISGSGDVYYKGNPSIISNISGSGELHHRN